MLFEGFRRPYGRFNAFISLLPCDSDIISLGELSLAYFRFFASSSEGRFGHECPSCKGYWRDEGGTHFCPYCGMREDVHAFLTTAQQSYVAQYCGKMRELLHDDVDGEYVIDMDAVADAAGDGIDKPPF